MNLKTFRDIGFQNISPQWGFYFAANIFITKISLLQSVDAALDQQSQRDDIFVIKKMQWCLSHVSDDIKIYRKMKKMNISIQIQEVLKT